MCTFCHRKTRFSATTEFYSGRNWIVQRKGKDLNALSLFFLADSQSGAEDENGTEEPLETVKYAYQLQEVSMWHVGWMRWFTVGTNFLLSSGMRCLTNVTWDQDWGGNAFEDQLAGLCAKNTYPPRDCNGRVGCRPKCRFLAGVSKMNSKFAFANYSDFKVLVIPTDSWCFQFFPFFWKPRDCFL